VIVKKFLQCTVAASVLLIGAVMAHAQSKPVLVVTAPSFDELLADVDFIGGLAGQQNAKGMVEGMIGGLTQGQGLKGLDRSKPTGVVVNIDNGNFVPTILIPSNNAKDLTDTLSKFNVVPPATNDGNALKVLLPNGMEVFVRDSNGYAVVTQTKDATLPADPVAALGGLNTTYDIGVRVFLQNVPAQMKQMAITQIRGVMQYAAKQQAEQGLGEKNMDDQVKAIEKLFNEADQITLGWKLDLTAKNTYLDFTFTGVPGSSLDKDLQALADAKTNYSGFTTTNAAVTSNFAGKMSAENIAQTINSLEQAKANIEKSIDNDDDLKDENTKKQVKTIANQVIDVLEKTIKSGKSDGGVLVMTGPNMFQTAVGFFVADGAGLDAALRNLVTLAQKDPEFSAHVTAKADQETYKDIKFHQFSVKVPDENAQRLFGETLDVFVGTGKDSAYIAAGKGGLDLLKGAIDRSAMAPAKATLPFQLTIALSPIVECIATQHPNPQVEAFSKALAANKGKDRILVTEKPISSGATVRILVEEGVLQAAGEMSPAKMNAGGGRGAARLAPAR
jgi:hypothetical protein